MVKASEQLCSLSEWKVHDKVLEALKGTGFDYLYTLATIVGRNAHDNRMLGALIKYYDIGDRAFKVINKTLFFGLEDILLITGFRVEGKPVIKVDKPCDWDALLGGVPESEIRPKSKAVSLKWLKHRFQDVPEDVIRRGTDSAEFAKYIRGFVLYILGTVIFNNKEARHVNMCFLEYLEDLSEIKNYAWGAAMLFQLHLCLEKDKEKEDIPGHLFFIMVWALEHIPAFVEAFFGGKLHVYPTEFPLSLGWARLLNTFISNRHRKKDYAQILDDIGSAEDDIVWQPYTRLEDNFLPAEIAGQRRMGWCRTVLIHPMHNCVIYHRPDLCPMKLGFVDTDVSTCRPLIPIKKKKPSREVLKVAWDNFETSFVKQGEQSEYARSCSSFEKRVSELKSRVNRLEKVVEVLKAKTFGNNFTKS